MGDGTGRHERLVALRQHGRRHGYSANQKTEQQDRSFLSTIRDMQENTRADLWVNLTSEIKPKAVPGDILFLSGPWSALSGGVKTDYTGRMFITVDSPTP